jgi:hypothetical protein
MKDDDLSPVEVFSGTDIEAVMIKNLLENENIEAYLWHEIQGIGQVIGSADAVQVVVSQHDFVKAKAIVDDYFKNSK